MSTKIYNAYRLSKNADILNVLKQMRELAIEEVAQNESLLRVIHIFAYDSAIKTLEKVKDSSPEWNNANYFLKKHEKGDLDTFYIKYFLEKERLSFTKSPVDVQFDCSVFYDDDYWYIKVFPNTRWMHDVIERTEKSIDEFEDFHYQNQTDPPDDIDYEDFQAREEKWDELLGEVGNYRNGFVYTIFDAYEFEKLLTRYHYTGEKDLYKHLAYKFDKTFEKEKDLTI